MVPEKNTLDTWALLLSAWRYSFRSRLFWLWGGVAASAPLVQNFWLDQKQLVSAEDLFSYLSTFGYKENILFFLFLFILITFSLLGKSNLTSLLHEQEKKDRAIEKGTSHTPSPFLLLWRGFKVECVTFLFFLFLLIILGTPGFLASSYNPQSASLLLMLGSITFLCVAFIFFFVKEFAFFYSVLSPLSLRQCFENGSRLFYRFPWQSASLGITTLLLIILFTFATNLVMLGITVLLNSIGFSQISLPVILLTSFLLLTWTSIFLRALWTLFFLEIARPKNPETTKEELPIPTEGAPEFPVT